MSSYLHFIFQIYIHDIAQQYNTFCLVATHLICVLNFCYPQQNTDLEVNYVYQSDPHFPPSDPLYLVGLDFQAGYHDTTLKLLSISSELDF